MTPDPHDAPTRPREPFVFGAVVVDESGQHWVRTYAGPTYGPAWCSGTQRRRWADLKFPATPTP